MLIIFSQSVFSARPLQIDVVCQQLQILLANVCLITIRVSLYRDASILNFLELSLKR